MLTTYTLGGLLKLFWRVQIFVYEENLSSKEFLGEKDLNKVTNTIGKIKDMFFKSIEEEVKEAKVITDEAEVTMFKMLNSSSQYMEFIDAT